MQILRLASLTQLYPLDMRSLTAIAPYASELSLLAGRRILLDGPFAHDLVLVGGGRGRVRCAGEIVAELGPGDAFGALAPPRPTYPAATVTAISDLRLVAFSTRDIRLLRQSAPDAADALLSACARGAAAVPVPQEPAGMPRLALAHAAA